jgi:hypothetical protein
MGSRGREPLNIETRDIVDPALGHLPRAGGTLARRALWFRHGRGIMTSNERGLQ